MLHLQEEEPAQSMYIGISTIAFVAGASRLKNIQNLFSVLGVGVVVVINLLSVCCVELVKELLFSLDIVH